LQYGLITKRTIDKKAALQILDDYIQKCSLLEGADYAASSIAKLKKDFK
jgi:hypothetical protein